MLLVFSSLSLGEVEAASKKESLAFEMKEMAKQSYNMNPKNSKSWMFYKKKELKDSLQYKIFRKKVGKKYDYAFAISGTKGLEDISVDYQVIIANRYNTQIVSLEKEVNNFYKKEKNNINKLYFTGHSLGGFLASYVVSDIVQNERVKGIPKSKVKAYTFNSPGFSTKTVKYKYEKGASYPTAMKVNDSIGTKKIKNNKKKLYNSYIINYKINSDVIASYNTSLGEIVKIKTKNLRKHKLHNFTNKNI